MLFHRIDIFFRLLILRALYLFQGMSCCSDFAVTFHYISPNQMYVMEYLIYHLHAYGVQKPFLQSTVDQLKAMSSGAIVDIARSHAVAMRGPDDVIFDKNASTVLSQHSPPPPDLLERMKEMVAAQNSAANP